MAKRGTKINISGKSWRVIFKKIKDYWGWADYTKREIVLDTSCEKHGCDREVLLHEAIHGFCPWMKEEAVENLATGLDDILDACGY